MKLYFVQVKWNGETSPVLITSSYEKAEKEKSQVMHNFESHGYDLEDEIWIDEKEIEDDVFYDYDWFNI